MGTRDAMWPDGIVPEHHHPHTGLRRHASPLRLLVLTVPLAAALAGLAGDEDTASVSGDGVAVSWHAPTVIRNGEIFETRLSVSARTAIGDLQIGMPSALWEDMTINTMIPAATEETSADGEFRFAFGPLASGTTFLLKIDAQINPHILGGNEGTIRIYDGERLLAELPVRIKVLP